MLNFKNSILPFRHEQFITHSQTKPPRKSLFIFIETKSLHFIKMSVTPE